MSMIRSFRGGLATGLAAAGIIAAGAVAYAGYDKSTLERTISRGSVSCGVSTGLPGFGQRDSNGNWAGFDVDFCRALAAAIFNDPTKVEFVSLNASERFKALNDRKIDVLARNTTWSMSRELEHGLKFAGVSYYDGQGFMLRKARNLDSALDLNNSKVCVQSGTTTQMNLSDFFNTNNMRLEEVRFQNVEDIVKAYESGSCNVMTADVSQLHSLRLQLASAKDHVILPDIISKEPLSPVVRHRDGNWLMIVQWTLYAMLNAEELGVAKDNIDAALKSKRPDVMRLIGTEGTYGADLNLTNDWAARIIRHVGNYGEVYERNVGNNSPLAIPRGLNQLWNAGGIQYAPPIR